MCYSDPIQEPDRSEIESRGALAFKLSAAAGTGRTLPAGRLLPTSNAGLLSSRETDRQTRLSTKRNVRSVSSAGTARSVMVRRRVHARPFGMRVSERSGRVSHGQAGQTAGGRDETLASSSTPCRFERRPDSSTDAGRTPPFRHISHRRDNERVTAGATSTTLHA